MCSHSTDPSAPESAPIIAPEDEITSDVSLVTCDDCGAECDEDDTREINGNTICQSCADDNYSLCERCDDTVSNDDLTDTGDNRCVCDSCLREHYTRCARCDDWTPDEDTIGAGCGSICQSCYENYYFICDGCGEVCHTDDYHGDGYCTDCRPSSEYIIDCSDDYHLDFFGKPRDGVFYGVELEVESVGDREIAAERTIDSLGRDFVVLKEDGSLDSEHGFEIVSAPATLDIHRERWTPFLDSALPLNSWQAGSCGMHVHFSRSGISELTLGKILVFINDPRNESFVVAIAGRNSSQYAKRHVKKFSDAKRDSTDRYQAVNTCNSDTIEIRIFKGTLKRESFLKNLEFVAATVAFCRQAGLQQIDVTSFLAFVDSRRKEYPNLASWLADRNFIAPRKKGDPKCA